MAVVVDGDAEAFEQRPGLVSSQLDILKMSREGRLSEEGYLRPRLHLLPQSLMRRKFKQ